MLAVGAIVLCAQNAGQPGAGRGGNNQPPAPNLSKRPTGSSLATIRAGASDEKIWFGWHVAIPASDFKGAAFSEVVPNADTLGVTGIEISSTQRTSPEVPKPFDYRLQAGERAAVVRHLREYNQAIYAYRVESMGAGEAEQRKVFDFAKSINVPLIVTKADASSAASLDKLASEFGISVAIESNRDPKAALAVLQGRSKHMGVAADLAGWMREGIKPVDGLAQVHDRLMEVEVRDHSVLGAKGKDVIPGSGAAGLPDFFLAAYRTDVKPLLILVGSTGAADSYGDFQKSLTGFEKVMWPAMAARVRAMLDSPAGKIRTPELLDADMKHQIEAGSPKQAIAPPKKKHKVLVTDIQMYSGHSSIPHGNYMLEVMAKNTGVFEPVFSNDLELLKYPKIKESMRSG